MTRPIRRPGYPWPGQFGLGPQSVDEIVRRLNSRPLGDAPKTQLGIRWVSPITDTQFQDLIDDSIVGPSEENRLFIAQEQRLSGDEVNGYAPSMWVQWAETDNESDTQVKYSLDIENEPFKVYFPMFAWMRSSNATLQAARQRVINRLLSAIGGTTVANFGGKNGARFPVFFNPRTGNWEAIALTETLPDHFVGTLQSTGSSPPDIDPAVYNSGDDDWTYSSGTVYPMVNKSFVTTPSVSLKAEWLNPEFPIIVVNGTDIPLVPGIPYLFWLDQSSGFYMPIRRLDMFSVTVPDNVSPTFDIDHEETKPCVLDDLTNVSIDVYNPGLRVWRGSKANVIWSTSHGQFEIVSAFSATKVRGVMTSTASAGGTGNIDDVGLVAMNGHLHGVSSSGMPVYMPPGTMNAVAGESVICDLEWTAANGSRWVITSVLRP